MTEGPFIPSDERKKLHADFLAETHKRELSGSENFDKSILTLSSAGLGISLTFLKDFAPMGHAVLTWGPWLLYASWVAFTFATLSTMSSFLVSGKALHYHKDIAYRFYIEGEDSVFDAPNPWNAWTVRLNYASAGTFFAALILTTAFVIITLQGNYMTTGQYKPQSSTSLEKHGATVPTMQRPAASPAPAPAHPAASPSSGQSGGSASQ